MYTCRCSSEESIMTIVHISITLHLQKPCTEQLYIQFIMIDILFALDCTIGTVVKKV